MTSKTRLLANLITNTGDVKAVNLDNASGGVDSAGTLSLVGFEADVFKVNNDNISINHTIDSADRAMSAGPISVDSGVTITVNGYWSVV